MKRNLLALVILIIASTQLFAHSGRTDKYGGHNCSRSSQLKGLCIGDHYHKHEDPKYIMLNHETSEQSQKVSSVRIRKNVDLVRDQ